MQEVTGDLFAVEGADAICITTNGFVKRDGAAVMGRGCAGQALKRWRGMDLLLGRRIMKEGNRVELLTKTHYISGRTVIDTLGGISDVPYHILSFPTKRNLVTREELLPYYAGRTNLPYYPSRDYPGFMGQSDLGLIGDSASQLVKLTDEYKWESVIIPRPGCGAGGLDWVLDVRTILEPIFDDRFHIITF